MEKSLKTLVGILLIIGTLHAKAEMLYAPQNCAAQDLKLMILSAAPQNQNFWIQLYKNKTVDEIRYEIPAQSSLIISGTEFLQNEEFFAIKTYSHKIRFYLACQGGGVSAFSEITSPLVEYKITADDLGHQILNLQNLSPEAQDISIRFYNDSQELIYDLQFHLEGYMESGTIKFLAPLPTRRIEIEGQGRISSSLKNAQNGRTYPVKVLNPYKVSVSEKSHYFLLSNESNTESFVVSIDDPNLVEEARHIIKEQLYKLTIATIEPGMSFNRDFRSTDRSPFSWHVAQVQHFADLAHIDCDGSPSLVEERFFSWMQAPQICFWSYHLKKELTPKEVSTGRFSSEKP